MVESEIISLVQNNIEYFRVKWDQFCQMVESYGKHVNECRNDPACEYDMDAETKRDLKERELSVNLSNVCYAFNKATQLGNHEKAKRLDQQRQEIEKELSESGSAAEGPEPGCERYNFQIQYLNIPMERIFWIRPAVNPLDYLLMDYPPENDLPVVYDCALLSIVHDNGNLTALDKRVFDYTSYEGYFELKNFCDAMLSKLRENPDSIDRAFDRVKAQLPTEPPTEEEWTKPMSKAKMMAAIGVDSPKTFNAFAKIHGIKQAGNRQTFRLRLDKMDQKTRSKLDKV